MMNNRSYSTLLAQRFQSQRLVSSHISGLSTLNSHDAKLSFTLKVHECMLKYEIPHVVTGMRKGYGLSKCAVLMHIIHHPPCWLPPPHAMAEGWCTLGRVTEIRTGTVKCKGLQGVGKAIIPAHKTKVLVSLL